MENLGQHLIVAVLAVIAAVWLIRDRRRRRRTPGCSDCPTSESDASSKIVRPSEIRPFPRSGRTAKH